MSTIRTVTAAICRALSGSTFFAASPVLDVIATDSQNIATMVQKAASTGKGAWCMVGWQGTKGVSEDVPGPELRPANFFVECNEIPTLWRTGTGTRPPLEEITEAVCRLLHMASLTDATGAAIAGVQGPLMLGAVIGPHEDKGVVSYVINLKLPVWLDSTAPTRS